MSKAINDKLNEIQYGIDDSFFDFLMADQTTDKGRLPHCTDQTLLKVLVGNIAALKACVQQIVAMGGQSKASDGDCLTASGLSVSSYIDQFNAFSKWPASCYCLSKLIPILSLRKLPILRNSAAT